MITNGLLASYLLHLLVSITRSLVYEKSFLLQDGAASAFAIALYKDSLLLTSSSDIIQKDIETGAIQRTFRAHTNQIISMLVTKDSRMITSGYDDMIIVWNLDSGSIIRRISLESSKTQIRSITFLDDQLFTGGYDLIVRQVDVTTGKITTVKKYSNLINCVLVSGDYLYVGTVSPTALLQKIHIPTSGLVLSFDGHRSSVVAVYLHDKILFSGSFDTTIICWNSESGALIKIFLGHFGYVNALAVQGNDLYSIGFDDKIIRWNITSGTIVRQFPVRHTSTVRCIALRNQTLFSGSDDTTIIKWNVTTGLALFVYRGREISLRAVAVWKTFIISAGDNDEIRFWDASINDIDPRATIMAHLRPVSCLLVYEETLFSGSSDRTIKQWNLTDFALLKVLGGHSDAVNTLYVKENFLYSGGFDMIAKKWNTTSGLSISDFIGHDDAIFSLQIYGDYLLSGSLDMTIKLWDLETTQNTFTIGAAQSVLALHVLDDKVVAGLVDGLQLFVISTRDILVQLKENVICRCIASSDAGIYTGHNNGVINVRNLQTLLISRTFLGHQSSVISICLDETGALFSASFDGSVKKWNPITAKISFSFENRSASVTSLAAYGNLLFVGTRRGTIHFFNTDTAVVVKSFDFQKKAASALTVNNDILYSSALDGVVVEFSLAKRFESSILYNDTYSSVNSLTATLTDLILLLGDTQIVLMQRNRSFSVTRTLFSASPITCLGITNDLIMSGSKTGKIFAWSFESFELLHELKGHTSIVNFIQTDGDILYSASNDKTVIQWSLKALNAVRILKRYSTNALGHLGPVNSLSICTGVLFSAGSDNTVRRWNTQTGKHEDVYFGFTKSVTSVVCYNGSVFAGSEDFSVLMFKPSLPQSQDATVKSSTTIMKRNTNQKRIIRLKNAVGSTINVTQVLVSVSIVLAVIIMVILGYGFLKKRAKKITSPPATITSVQGTESTQTIFDLETVVNSVMGISKHAAYLIENSSLAKVKKIAAGGGGELFLAKVMDPGLRKKLPEIVVQKIVFVKSKINEEAFYQEVGIMILLSSFPYFCKIIGYTENPLSMILKNYPDGSLSAWLGMKRYGTKIIIKILKETALALSIMHSYYLAHCDLKPQNILVELENGVPSCFLTDFGITQILSEKIIATKAFHVINLRGLSTHYAAPEAFRNFRAKKYVRVDFKAYDIYSFGCIAYEVLTRNTPWH